MSGELPRLNRLRTRDTKVEYDETCKVHSEEEDDKVEMFDKKATSRKASTAASSEKGRRIDEPIQLSDDDDDDDKEKSTKYKEKKGMHDKKKKIKKSVIGHGGDRKTHGGDLHHKDKKRDMLNKGPHLKEKGRKTPSGDKKMHRGDDHHSDNRSKHSEKEKKKTPSGDKKVHRGDDHHNDYRSKHSEKEKKKTPSSQNDRSCDYDEYKGMQKKDKKPWRPMETKVHNGDSREEKKHTSLLLSKQGKIPMLHNNDDKGNNKRKKTAMVSDKAKKKIRTGDKDDKAGSCDRNNTINTWQKLQSGRKDKTKGFFRFLKICMNDFEEFLLIPPKFVPRMEYLTNHRVYLEDTEGKCSKVRLSEVDGSLAFCEGWNSFVSNHSIKWGEILLFERTDGSRFSVSVFGVDFCERVSFSVERQDEQKKQKDIHAQDDLVPCHTPKVRNSRDITRSSERILITDEAPLAKNGDAVKLATFDDAAPETHCVMTANTKQDPEIVASGALDSKEANLAIGECKTKCDASLPCNKEKTTAPLVQGNGDALEQLTTFAPRIKDASMMNESTSAQCGEMLDSDEDLRRKQERKTIKVDCTAAVDKCPNNNNMDSNGNACCKYESPGGSQCLEKRKEATVSGLIRPEKRLKTEEISVGAMGANAVEQSLRGYDGIHLVPSQISTSGISRIKIEHSVNGKGTAVKPETKMESIGCKQERNSIPASANHAVARQTVSHAEDMKSSNPVPRVPVNVEASESDGHSALKANLQFTIPSTTQTRLELPDSLSDVVGRKGWQDRSIIMLKDPMKRLWPVFYLENSLFVGFTGGWKSFVAGNNLETGDLCVLREDLDEDELVYYVQIKRK